MEVLHNIGKGNITPCANIGGQFDCPLYRSWKITVRVYTYFYANRVSVAVSRAIPGMETILIFRQVLDDLGVIYRVMPAYVYAGGL